MDKKLHVGTRKGLFTFQRTAKGWDVAETKFLGEPVTAVLDDGKSVWAALDLGHFGPKLWRRDCNSDWREITVPTFPEKPEDTDDDPHPW